MPTLNFDATQVDPSTPFEALPSGKYLVEITNSQQRATKSGDGSYLEIEYCVLEGEYRSRKVWDRLCLNHPNQKTVEIARANLSAICHAVGVMRPRDSSELHHIPLVLSVKTRKDEGKDEIYNEIKGYAKYESNVAKQSQQVSQYPQAPADEAAPPWGRSK